MKTTLILLTIIFAAAWAGCSDNLNVTDPLGGHNSYVQNQPNHPADSDNGELLWSLDELKVWASSQSIAENKAVYKSPPRVPPLVSTRGYKVSFDVSTNADRTTNGYAPLVEVYKDDGTMYSGYDFTSGGESPVHKEIDFKGTFSQIKFYIALFQSDGGNVFKENVGNGTIDDGTVDDGTIDDGNVDDGNAGYQNVSYGNESNGNAKSVQLILRNINIFSVK